MIVGKRVLYNSSESLYFSQILYDFNWIFTYLAIQSSYTEIVAAET